MLARFAPFCFVLLWSSSFVAAKTGLRDLSPLLFVAVRLAACAVVLLALMALSRQSWRPLGRGRWAHCAVAGALINAGGLMGPHVGLLLVPAAHIALVQSLTPLLSAGLGVVLLHERLRLAQWLGLALGVAGVGLVVGLAAIESATRLEGLILAFVGVVSLVAGTLYFGRFCRGIPMLAGVTVQFLSAAAVSALCAAVLEAPRANWTEAAIAAVAWNTIAVSLGGMALYYYMLARGSVAA
ncbi:MAG: DMT family transporter, partial [Acetobacteraceae bacterium]